MADKITETKVPRFMRSPTDDNLKEDCIKICQRLFDMWDGEVDFTIISARRGDPRSVQYATTVRFADHVKVQTELVRNAAMRDLKKVSGRG